MKFDMHCHTKEGSTDSRVKIEDFIKLLKKRGFGGMVVTDHDTYGGYRCWKRCIKNREHRDFVVLKGIEYDTLDAGHILIIMPETIKLRLLELRGIPVQMLIPIVHNYGGILGPAHPCGEKYMSFTNAKAYQRNPEIMKEFDFVETFNACESEESNRKAQELADKYGLPGFGGSDAHKEDCVGLGYAVLPDHITCETDLIKCVKEQRKFVTGGELYTKTTKEKMGAARALFAQSFWVYNKVGGWSKALSRNNRLKQGFVEHVEPVRLKRILHKEDQNNE